MDPSPDAFRAALRTALDLDADDPALPALAERDTRTVLLLDTVESIEALGEWLRTQFLPDLPDNVIVMSIRG